MTVKQLLRKLKNVPEDFEVTIRNSEVFVEGTYRADGIEVNTDYKHVMISSDYKYLWNNEGEKWVK